jgi:hypothetical protein
MNDICGDWLCSGALPGRVKDGGNDLSPGIISLATIQSPFGAFGGRIPKGCGRLAGGSTPGPFDHRTPRGA